MKLHHRIIRFENQARCRGKELVCVIFTRVGLVSLLTDSDCSPKLQGHFCNENIMKINRKKLCRDKF